MKTFFEKESHHKWISFIGDGFLHHKGLSLDAHVAVITQNYTWMSGWNLLTKECRFIFMYAGGLNFHMVCNKVEGFKHLQKWALDLSKNPHGITAGKKSKTELSTVDTKKSKKYSAKPHTKRCKSRRLITVPLPYKVVKAKQWKTKTAQRAALNASKISLDNVLKDNHEKKCIATPRLLTEEDPIAAHLSNPSDLDDPASDHESDYKEDEQNIETIQTKAGQLDIAKHGLVKKERKVKKITCPVCDNVIYTQKRMNVHMRELHPRFMFQCSLCESLFKSYNAAYQHTQMHFQLRYVCDICGHRSQYPSAAEAHMKTHTKKKVIPCT